MPTKAEAIADPESTWNKTADDEEVFVLRSRDHLMPMAVRAWIRNAQREGVNHEKIAEAKLISRRAEIDPRRRRPD